MADESIKFLKSELASLELCSILAYAFSYSYPTDRGMGISTQKGMPIIKILILVPPLNCAQFRIVNLNFSKIRIHGSHLLSGALKRKGP